MTDPQIWTLIGVFAASSFALVGLVSTTFLRILRAEIGSVRAEIGALRAELLTGTSPRSRAGSSPTSPDPRRPRCRRQVARVSRP